MRARKQRRAFFFDLPALDTRTAVHGNQPATPDLFLEHPMIRMIAVPLILGALGYMGRELFQRYLRRQDDKEIESRRK